MPSAEASGTQGDSQRLELGYCPRCGSLRVFRPGAADEVCSMCAHVLDWIYFRGRMPNPGRGRPRGGKP